MNWKRKGDSLTLLHFIRIQVPITSPPSSAARRRTLSLSLPYRVKSVMSSSRGGAFAGNMWSGGGGDRLPAYSHPFPGISGLRAGERVGKSAVKGRGREQHILKFQWMRVFLGTLRPLNIHTICSFLMPARKTLHILQGEPIGGLPHATAQFFREIKRAREGGRRASIGETKRRMGVGRNCFIVTIFA